MTIRFGSKTIIASAGVLFLAACFGPQEPAPVTLYGAKPGAGSTGVHRVSSGDTLYSISKRYNVVMRDVVVTNHLSAPFILSPGQRLKLPSPQEYKVRSGDTLSEVSRLFGASASEVAALNNMRAPYVLKTGQTLKLPGVTAKATPAVIRPAAPAPSVQMAAVQPVAPPPPRGYSGDNPSQSLGTLRYPAQPQMLSPPSQAPSQAQPSSQFPPQPQGVEPSASVQTASLPPKQKITAATPKRGSSKFLEPVSGRVVSGYGPKDDGLHNDGINIAAPQGTPVLAAENGVVVYAGNELKGSGNLVLIRHEDRWMTAYAHMNDIAIKRGDVVSRGQKIGSVGSTGSVDTPQLHFEVRRGTEAINPVRYLES